MCSYLKGAALIVLSPLIGVGVVLVVSALGVLITYQQLVNKN